MLKDKKKKNYCDFIDCKSLGSCTIVMSGEDCYTLGLVREYLLEKAQEYEKYLREIEVLSSSGE